MNLGDWAHMSEEQKHLRNVGAGKREKLGATGHVGRCIFFCKSITCRLLHGRILSLQNWDGITYTPDRLSNGFRFPPLKKILAKDKIQAIDFK